MSPLGAFFTVSPLSVPFGTIAASVTASANVTITFHAPPGVSTFGTWSNATVTGGFALAGLPGLPQNMMDGQSFTFQVTINQPSGSFTGNLTLFTNLKNFVIPLSATIGSTALTISPTILSFPSEVVGTLSAPLTTVITNNTGTPVQISQPTFSNPDFRESPANVYPITIPNGGTLTISVAVNPSVAGSDSGTMTVPTNDPSVPTLTVSLFVVGFLFTEVNALQGINYVFLMGFGTTTMTRQLNPFDLNSELPLSLTFAGTVWDGVATEKVIRRLLFYYEHVGTCTLTATATVIRYNQAGAKFTDSETSTVVIGPGTPDQLEYSAYFDFQIAGEIIDVTITRNGGAGPCVLYMFVPSIEEKGEKVENV